MHNESTVPVQPEAQRRTRVLPRAPQPTTAAAIGRRSDARTDVRDERGDSERRCQFLIDNMPELVWSAGSADKTTFVSANVTHICGFTPDEILAAPGNIWIDRAHPEDRARVRDAYTALLSARLPFAAEYRWQRKDEAWIWLRARAVIGSLENPQLVDGILSDITEQKLLEEQVRQLQKMEAVGELTGGIAHDFKNLLTVILGTGRFLLEALPDGDPTRADAEVILQAAERASALTKQLLSFSRQRAPERKILNLNTIVLGMEQILRRVIGEDIRFSFALAERLEHICADPVQIEQVIMNLVINARDAMPRGGTLSIETANVELGANPQATRGQSARGTYVMLAVSDTGCGMDSETRRRMFEPLFTTKEAGKGTGLGLSTCYGIVKQSEGLIGASSEPGAGSSFKVYLPKVTRPQEAKAAGTVATVDPTGTETILVVEDNDGIRRLARRILERLGYRILEASNGLEALAVCQAHEDVIHLVLSDVIIPDLNGPELVRQVQARSKTTKALFMSGYTDHALLRDGVLQAGANFIQKPFDRKTLATKIREALDA